jgi:Flp pilus assembly protein TadG
MTQRYRKSGPKGTVLLYTLIAMTAFIGMVSLGVDAGHVRVVKKQLQRTADAAARAAAAGLVTSTVVAQNNAISVAQANTADGTVVVLTPSTDIEFGTWNSSTGIFTVLTGAAQSTATVVRVTARRTSATGNAVNLPFASMIGMSTCDVTAVSIASVKPATPPYGFVGLSKLEIKDVTTMDSYDSSIGYPASAGNLGTIATNLAIKIDSAGTIHGSVAGPAGANIATGGSLIYGQQITLPAPMNYPPASAGSATTSNNNSQVPAQYLVGGSFSVLSGTVSLPGGVYYFANMNVSPGATLTFSGAATIYVTGALSMDGTLNTYQSRPTNLSISVVGAGNVDIQHTTALYASIYAPQSKAGMKNDFGFFGAIVTDQIKFQGSSGFHYDTTVTFGGNASISVVQ